MNIPSLFLVTTCALSLSACIPSLHPVFNDKDKTYDKALVGTWTGTWGEKKTTAEWKFESHGKNEYNLIYSDNDTSGQFTATLATIHGERYLDLFPDEPSHKETNPFYIWHMIPTHTFLKVKQIEPTLQMAFLNPNEVEDILDEDPEALSLIKTEGRVFMTSSTEELQAFLKKYGKNERLFTDYSNFSKTPEEKKD